ncbi:MAG: hypothetical protein HY904_23140 [Deltaproteobacteria bacterium]|nr:hypothetical protein [Deltaproteobacteria bacterium]
MRARVTLVLAVAVTLTTAGGVARADISNAAGWGTLPYEGMLERNGLPLAATADLRFTLFNDPVQGNVTACPSTWCLWQEEQTGVPVTAGAFSVRLGERTALTDAVAASVDLFLAVEVRSSGEPAYTALTGRQRLGSAAFALAARRAVPEQDFAADRNVLVGGSVGIGAGAAVPAAPLHVAGVARADQIVTSPSGSNQLLLQGSAMDALGGPILLGAGGAGGAQGPVAIPQYADIGPAWSAGAPGTTNPQRWRYGDCELKINMLQRPATFEATYSAYGTIGSVAFAPSQADLAALYQWGWVCWNRSDSNEDDDLLHPFLGSLRADASGPYAFPTASGTQRYAVRGRISLNQDYVNWAASQKVCGRVGWIAPVDSNGNLVNGGNEFRILAWYGNTYYYGFYDLTDANPNHGLWHDTAAERAGASGSYDRWSLWVCR